MFSWMQVCSELCRGLRRVLVYSSASLGNKNMKLRSSGGSGFARKEGGEADTVFL
jgi:hypothetical protein